MHTRIETFLEDLAKTLTEQEVALVRRAASKAEILHQGQKRASGEPYFIHPLEVAEILWDMQMDSVTLAAAFLHDTLEDTSLSRTELREQFGKEVESLVFGVTKIDIVKTKNKNAAEAETIRKMLFAMVKDIRIILIKLADKLHNMRTLQHKPVDKQKSTAHDTLDIFAPLAARLGISWMKDELEDLSLKFLHPEVYQQIKEYVASKKNERSDYLVRVASAIEQASLVESLVVEVETRAKHFYSIYSKMKERNKSLDEIYDLLGIRILCDTMHDCYILLGLVHRLWMPIEGRFKDYIAMPKANRYQSLHTTVMCYDGRLTEIQIRTRQMDETAEFGVAAHWVYKRVQHKEQIQPADLTIINRLRDLNNVKIGSGDFLEEIKKELLRDSIYVFTPKGNVVQLPKDSTAIDFAYHIHTEVGHHASAAKADGAIIPLKASLKNTQVIEIITNAHAHPHVDWLRAVKTGRTRQKIRAWLNHHDENLIIDRNIVARKPPAPSITSKKSDATTNSQNILGKDLPIVGAEKPTLPRTGIKVGDERNLMIRFANCCEPVVGDDIIGYVSRGRGIMIHRRNCSNLGNISDLAERSLEVEWESISPRITKQIKIKAFHSGGLFGDIEGLVKKYKGHMISGKIDEAQGDYLEGNFSLEMPRATDFKKLIKELRSFKNIHQVVEGEHEHE